MLRKIWKECLPNLKINDIVLVIDPDTPRGQWPLGRVTKTFFGKDKNVRKVEVLTNGKVICRPISKLCPLNLETM